MSELKIGTKVKDRYILKELRGSGSFGEVWLAYDDVLGADIAIKIYITLDHRGVDIFRTEYVITEGIYHPNLLTAKYFDVWEQHPFLVMKYCENGSCASIAGVTDEAVIWHFIHDVASGLNYLHNLPEPIIHQDIKPDNVLISDTGFVITDFGISKKLRSTLRKQTTRAIGAGATAYMPPEKFESRPQTLKASDIWSLGVSIYELATGELPFCGMGGMMQKNGAEIPYLDSKWSRELNKVMQSCLAKDAWNRPLARQLEVYSESMINGLSPKTSLNNHSSNTNGNVPDTNTSNNGADGQKKGVKVSKANVITGKVTGKDNQKYKKKSTELFNVLIVMLIAGVILTVAIYWATNQENSYSSPEIAYDSSRRETPYSVNDMYWLSPLGKCRYSGTVKFENGEWIPDGRGKARIVEGRYKGCIYEGDFSKGKMNGEATYTLSNGDSFKGEFRNNKYYRGTYTMKSTGECFHGSFDSKGEPDVGIWYDKNGKMLYNR